MLFASNFHSTLLLSICILVILICESETKKERKDRGHVRVLNMSSSEVELVNIGFDPKNFSGTPLVKKTRRKVNGTTKAVSIVGLEPLQSTELNSSLQSLQIGDWQSITTPETPTIFFASSAAAAAGDNLFVEEKDAESENFRVVSVLNNDKVGVKPTSAREDKSPTANDDGRGSKLTRRGTVTGDEDDKVDDRSKRKRRRRSQVLLASATQPKTRGGPGPQQVRIMMNKDANDDTAPPEAPVNLELSSESIDSNGKRQISADFLRRLTEEKITASKINGGGNRKAPADFDEAIQVTVPYE